MKWAIYPLILLFLLSFGIGLASTPWVVISEIMPLKLRSTAVCLASMANWTANFVINSTFWPISKTSFHMEGAWAILAVFTI